MTERRVTVPQTTYATGVGSISTSEGTFTAEMAGPTDGPVVIFLHGYPQSRHAWRHQVPGFAAAGYRAVAYDGRGYSPGVRPDPAVSLDPYRIERLVADVLDIADTIGGSGCRFHLVGHDWGGQVAWATAAWNPGRLRSLSVLSRPHPAAFRIALTSNADDQKRRSRHHRAFHDPGTGSLLLDDNARRLRRGLVDANVPTATVDDYVGVLGTPAAIEGALAWYRAAGSLAVVEVGPIPAPTLYVWGSADASVGRAAAVATRDQVSGPYRFVELTGVGHFITDEVPETTSDELLAWANAHGS